MELSYENADALVHSIGGTSAKHLSAFVKWLIANQYSVSYVCQLAGHALAFWYWCESSGILLHTLSEDDIVRYQCSRQVHRSRCLETCRRERHALKLLLQALRHEGICPTASIHSSPIEEVTLGFARYLKHSQGLADATIESYTRSTHQFLVWRFLHGNVCLSDLCANDSIAFVQNEAKRLGPPALKNIVTALRSFLRYGQFLGEVPAGLAIAVPAVAGWATTPAVPNAISTHHARLAINSCNCLTSVGMRDRAILLLLARLGLRAIEIIRLMLDDINWDHAQLRVHSKGGRECLLPLTTEVGEAIATYLEFGRPVSQDRHLFLRSVAPIHGFMEGSDAIGTIVRYALNRANVDAPHRGSHQFRHALAAHMLRTGASLPEIGRVLRHRSPQSTSLYAKVDLGALRTLALTWPGGAQ